MILLIQRVARAGLSINGKEVGEIGKGLLVYVGFEKTDKHIDNSWISNKLLNMRLFTDSEGKMNDSMEAGKDGLMLIPNFTLAGNAEKGFRPSYGNALDYDIAESNFKSLVEHMNKASDEKNLKFVPGVFGADMKIDSVNDGPVNIIINKETA